MMCDAQVYVNSLKRKYSADFRLVFIIFQPISVIISSNVFRLFKPQTRIEGNLLTEMISIFSIEKIKEFSNFQESTLPGLILK